MSGKHAAIVLIVCGLSLGTPLASHPDGIALRVDYGAAPGSVRLSWAGAPPNFGIYRATSPIGLLAPPNQIAFTGFTSWGDTPPSGIIYYYEITSSCSPGPLEVCDGLDNDCNGTVDGPGSEASCGLPNATSQCVAGACDIASCNTGWGDCDGNHSDGCETPINRAQSTSPAAYGGPANPDLKAGYVRVPSVTNCGGCGVTCDDGIPCTTDLCVPSAAGQGQCRHYNRAQCAGARCQGPLPPGTPTPTEPACAGLDGDGDGLPAAWETAQTDPYTGVGNPPGVDLNCDGEISDAGGDLIWHEPPSGDGTKDIYLEYDYMVAAAGEAESHAPPPSAVAQVVAAMGSEGITLHIDPTHQGLPHSPIVYLPVTGPVDSCASQPGPVSLYDPLYKGNPANHDPRRTIGYHYFLFGHNSCYGPDPIQKASGMAEVGGNDGIISLGDFPYLGTPPEIVSKKVREQTGTFFHELGHNIGLCHDGVANAGAAEPCGSLDIVQKPNHMSDMNYQFQLNGITRAQFPGTTTPPDPVTPRRPDFSHEELATLDEGFLNEVVGINVPAPPRNRDITRYFCPSGLLAYGPSSGGIDWNCDGAIDFPVVGDINADSQVTTLAGASEWDNLFFRFQCNPTYAEGAQEPSRLARSELTLEQAASRGLRAGPLLCPTGSSDCDGNDANGCETPGSCSGVPTCSPNSLWSAPLGPGPASAPASDTEFNPTGGSFSYLAKGNTVYSIYNQTVPGHVAGSINWTRLFPTTVQAVPTPVLLHGGGESVFVAGMDGFLRRLDASTGVDLLPAIDTRRVSCPADQLLATPAVQLWDFANAAFKTAQSEDLIIVITRYQCADTQNNKVIAIRAGSGTVAWTFNPNATLGLPMSYGSEGCSLDYTNNLLYCGTHQPGVQRTLWAINTTDGTLQWSRNVGSILNRPVLRAGRVYAATHSGRLWVLAAMDGTPIWNTQVTAANFVRNPQVVSGGSFDGLILMTDTAGFLHAFVDAGNSGSVLWGPTDLGGTVNSMPALSPALGKAYVGMSNGQVRQVDLATGAVEATATAGTGIVYDPSFDFAGPPGTEINRLTVAAEGPSEARRYCIPWVPGDFGTQ